MAFWSEAIKVINPYVDIDIRATVEKKERKIRTIYKKNKVYYYLEDGSIYVTDNCIKRKVKRRSK